MMDWTLCDAVERDVEKVSGAWVFRGTRVPLTALFENLEGVATIDDFLSWFPGVTREQVTAALEYAIKSLKKRGLPGGLAVAFNKMLFRAGGAGGN